MPRLPNHPLLRVAGLLVGVGLTGAAAWFALGHDWHRALTPLLNANPMWVIALATAVVGQLLLTGLLFWVVTLSFDAQPPVGPVRMIQVIAASSLLSYLPLEAGFLGRTAYLKLRHGLPVRPVGVDPFDRDCPEHVGARGGCLAGIVWAGGNGTRGERFIRGPGGGGFDCNDLFQRVNGTGGQAYSAAGGGGGVDLGAVALRRVIGGRCAVVAGLPDYREPCGFCAGSGGRRRGLFRQLAFTDAKRHGGARMGHRGLDRGLEPGLQPCRCFGIRGRSWSGRNCLRSDGKLGFGEPAGD